LVYGLLGHVPLIENLQGSLAGSMTGGHSS
jgi:hypothetical protein